jgi:hypothetical protein
MKRVFCSITLFVLMTSSLTAQDLSGDWQGAGGTGKERQRMILHVDKADDGGWKATLFAIDIQPDGIPVTSITQHGSTVAFSIPELKVSYKGTVRSDGASIVGKMDWEGTAQVTFVHPTKATAWPRDVHCSCTVSFVPVGQGVKLRCWTGTGPDGRWCYLQDWETQRTRLISLRQSWFRSTTFMALRGVGLASPVRRRQCRRITARTVLATMYLR